MSGGEGLMLELHGWGTAQMDLAQMASLRKQVPAWAPAGTPGHFLKHADEHTIVAVTAVDRAIREHQLDLETLRTWSIIAAPRFMGRFAGATALERYGRGGGPSLSPHLIPQHSLHSVSGALSILLASRRPNFGVGGGADALAEGLLAALTLPSPTKSSGVLLVATAFDSEPVIDRQGNCVNSPVCYAAALALETAATTAAMGGLRLETRGLSLDKTMQSPITVADLCRSLEAGDTTLSWTVPGGLKIGLQLRTASRRLAA